jgi:hypothetical protein
MNSGGGKVQRFRFYQILLMLSVVYVTDSSAQQTTSGYCSPAIENVTGNVVTNCYTTITAFRKSVDDNLAETIAAIEKLLTTQAYYMFPSLNDYVFHPLNWSRLSVQKFRVDKWSLCRG